MAARRVLREVSLNLRRLTDEFNCHAATNCGSILSELVEARNEVLTDVVRRCHGNLLTQHCLVPNFLTRLSRFHDAVLPGAAGGKHGRQSTHTTTTEWQQGRRRRPASRFKSRLELSLYK